VTKIRRWIRYDLPLHFILLVTNWLPDSVVFLRLRGFLARPFFGKCGKNLLLGRHVAFYNPARMHFGNSVYIAYGCWLSGSVEIHDEVLLGPYCTINSTNHQRKDGSFRFGGATPHRTVVVKKGSWLGAKATMTAGSSLGQGSVLAANSVLTEAAADHSVYAGIPAQCAKQLPS
jgi:acetyltransferase-like isoleucine patch superfamily enzyme